MNAMISERDDAAMLTNEAIEVHLMYLRSALDQLNARVDKLTERVRENSEAISDLQSHQKATLWVFSTSSIVAAMVSIANTLNWI